MKKITVLFYENQNGKKPVLDWLKSLRKDDRKSIGEVIKKVEYGFPIGMPTCKKLDNGLYEVRSNIADGKIARVIFVIISNYMILLHGFIKKAQKIPKEDIKLALKRKKDIKCD